MQDQATMKMTKQKKKLETILDRKRREFGIPEFDSYPGGDTVIIWRLPPFEMSAGGIVIPQEAQNPNTRGVVLAVGADAMAAFDRKGYRVGHTVLFKKYAGWEHEDRLPMSERTPEHKRACQILHINVSDILASDDLGEDVKAGRTRFIKDSATGEYVIEQKRLPYELAEDKANARREKLRRLAGQSASPNEAANARRLLAKEKS